MERKSLEAAMRARNAIAIKYIAKKVNCGQNYLLVFRRRFTQKRLNPNTCVVVTHIGDEMVAFQFQMRGQGAVGGFIDQFFAAGERIRVLGRSACRLKPRLRSEQFLD